MLTSRWMTAALVAAFLAASARADEARVLFNGNLASLKRFAGYTA